MVLTEVASIGYIRIHSMAPADALRLPSHSGRATLQSIKA